MRKNTLKMDDLLEKSQTYSIKIAIFQINILFVPSEQVILKQQLIDNFIELWGIFVGSAVESPDLTIEVGVDTTTFETHIKDSTYFLPGWRWDLQNKRLSIYNLYSIWVIQTALRQALTFLIEGRGFLLHASGVVDKSQKLHAFMAVSGGGKSTTAKSAMKSGMRMMSDDTILMIKNNRKWVAYSPTIVEKECLPTQIISNNHVFYNVNKASKLESKNISEFNEKLKIILPQVWTFQGEISDETYRIIIDFVKQAKIKNLYLPKNPKNLSVLLNED